LFDRWGHSNTEEYDYYIDEVDGELPTGLRGCYIRNGPGNFDVGGVRSHFLDCDGMLAKFAFQDDRRVRFTNKFIRTEEFVKESQTGKRMFAGIFKNYGPLYDETWLGSLMNRIVPKITFKNTANTCPWMFGGKLLALYEGGRPHYLNHETLETIGIETLDNSLRKKSNNFSAHPKEDPVRK
jgi:all-trans-8'-apo-beta-carotenal 15,15'-oxygenase